MYIAMNRFKVARGRESAFEEVWRNRQSYLDDVPGFREFHLLRGPSTDEITLYASHSQWDSREAFTAWTKSDAFKRAHGRTHSTEATIVGHPQFEGFEAVL
ncbi:MAG: antibiotic biosynthesis monooxygenase family protein [Candidatus Krumholzibacteriia bacterium]